MDGNHDSELDVDAEMEDVADARTATFHSPRILADGFVVKSKVEELVNRCCEAYSRNGNLCCKCNQNCFEKLPFTLDQVKEFMFKSYSKTSIARREFLKGTLISTTRISASKVSGVPAVHCNYRILDIPVCKFTYSLMFGVGHDRISANQVGMDGLNIHVPAEARGLTKEKKEKRKRHSVVQFFNSYAEENGYPCPSGKCIAGLEMDELVDIIYLPAKTQLKDLWMIYNADIWMKNVNAHIPIFIACSERNCETSELPTVEVIFVTCA